ncbi:MAG: 4Fe-4S dicluster domain-containing protein [Verrucomicrobiia bacterium]
MKKRDKAVSAASVFRLELSDIERLFSFLEKNGYEVCAPVVKDGAVVYKRGALFSELPFGWKDYQEKGDYRIEKTDGKAIFNYTVAANSWKQFLFKPVEKLFAINRNGWQTTAVDKDNNRPLAFFGVRPCELAAISILDKVFDERRCFIPEYKKRREILFIIAVNCTRAGNTCFCSSMGTGPKAKSVYDIVLTEMIGDGGHYFICETGTERGKEIISELKCQSASAAEVSEADSAIERAASSMGRIVKTAGVNELLYEKFESQIWDEIAERCLTCGNCTMVCPTCFCNQVEDGSSFDGKIAWRYRKWDSCFSLEFSYIHGGSVRASAKSRYRQWLVHKFAAWYEQFGLFGCVGCGRCITWCPSGIDITEEIKIFQTETQS